jgi:hypothetical protein
MTTHCANPACGARFQYFRTGKVYLIDFKSAYPALRPPRDMEYFWLCGNCSPKMRVSLDSEGKVILEQLEATGSQPSNIRSVNTGASDKKVVTA